MDLREAPWRNCWEGERSWAGREPADMDVDASPELLRAEPTMHSPLLIPDRLERSGRHLGHQGQHVWAAERAEAVLRTRIDVRISLVWWRRGIDGWHLEGKEYQTGVEVGLVEGIEVNVRRQIPQGPDETAIR